MFITKKHIPRRTFLRGAGVTMALPLLESMVPAQTPLSKTAAAPYRRFVGIWHPHGAAPGYWSPLQEGKNFEFSFITKPLEPFRNHVRLHHRTGHAEVRWPPTEEPGGDHARGAVLLSGARPRRNAVSPYLGVTIDQLVAQKYGQDTILSSLQLGVEDDGNFGNCNWGYSCAYTNSHFLDVAHAAASDGSQSARGVRAAVRRWNQYRRARCRDESRTPASWIRSRTS